MLETTAPYAPPEPIASLAGVRLGIDGDALKKPLSGVGQYVHQLCCALDPLLPASARAFVYTRHPASALALASPRWQVRQEPLPALRRVPSFAWLKTRGRMLCAHDQLDVFWAGRTLHPGLAAPVRTISTVHDLNHLIVPETMQPATRWSHRLWFTSDLRRADCVIANSEGTRARLGALLAVRSAAVLHPGVDARFRVLDADERQRAEVALRELDIRPPYLLSVATLEPRKNVAATFQAFVALKREGALPDHQLVLAGARGWPDPALTEALAQAHGLGVRVPGFVPESSLAGLYALADLVLLPSLYEGFGMPVLEARACGARVLISDVPELREAAGPGAVAVTPTVAGIADGVVRALRTPADPAAAADARRGFSWEAGARQLAGLLTRGPI